MLQNKRRAFKSEEIVPPFGDAAKREGGSGGVTCAGGGMWGRREAKEDEEKQVRRWLGSREESVGFGGNSSQHKVEREGSDAATVRSTLGAGGGGAKRREKG